MKKSNPSLDELAYEEAYKLVYFCNTINPSPRILIPYPYLTLDVMYHLYCYRKREINDIEALSIITPLIKKIIEAEKNKPLF